MKKSIVVSHYNSFQFLDLMVELENKFNFIIYNKSNELLKNISINRIEIKCDNVGREGSTYINHIINNYNNLNKSNNCNNSWSRAYVAAVRVPLDDFFAAAACHIPSSSCNFYPLTNLSHCLNLILSSIKVMRARSITAMAHARSPCIFIALLLVSY